MFSLEKGKGSKSCFPNLDHICPGCISMKKHWNYISEFNCAFSMAQYVSLLSFLIIPLFNMIASFQYAAPQSSYLHSLTFQLEFWSLV